MKLYFKFSIVFFLILLFSCSSDDSPRPELPDGDFAGGTLILNEGGSAGGSVSFLSNDLQELTNSIFEDNTNQQPGLFLQSIFFDDDKAFIISNGSNLISVVNRFSFELIGTIDSGLSVPRYGVTYNGKAYVTNLDSFGEQDDDFIAIIDIETLEVDETVILGTAAERILELNGEIYVQGAVFGSGNKVVKFDPSTKTIVETLDVGEGLNSLQKGENEIYTLDEDGLKIINAQDFSIKSELDKPESLGGIGNLRVDANLLYYTSGSEVYSISKTDSELSDEPILDYGGDSDFGVFYGFEVNESQIFIGDAGDFTSNGKVFVYSLSGQLLAEKTVGDIAPNSFYFQ